MPLKQSLYIFLLFIFSISVSSFTKNKDDFVLVIDPGHGGHDPGAIGKKGKEKDVALAVALLTGKYITEQNSNVKIIYTRDKDEFVDLWKRADIANKNKADLFISIHANASINTNIRGSEVYAFGISRTQENLEVAKRENSVIYLENNYKEKYENFDPNISESYIIFEFMQNNFVYQSLDFASIVQAKLKSCVPWAERGIKQAEYLVLRKTCMPRILIELDFITNPEAEMYLLSENGQQNYARAICTAFTKYKINYDNKNNITTKYTNEKTTNKILSPKDTLIENEDADNKIYKVQIFASLNKLPQNDPQFKGYKVDYYEEDNLYKYTYGASSNFNEILQIQKNLLNIFKEAFIICFENNVKIKNIQTQEK